MKSTEELLKIAVAALEDIKANDIRVMDVSKLTSLCHYMIVASADSTRQTKALANHVHEKVKAAGEPIHSIEGEQTGEWLLVDLGDIIVHIMQPAIRSYYDLEGLWADAAWQTSQKSPAVSG
ncbi:MAG: ribosome silencing factor [Nitrosomonas sp.]|uniref:ribosome silencing factor n=1 Tax=Nitrosomonas sp. TaxID=42353 RepID=UPI0025E338AA|nr:ribosome silencing factor [Nitrosomonas sp.]MCC6161022.1 ribosome silencing factor [Nitrosomonas sp.]